MSNSNGAPAADPVLLWWNSLQATLDEAGCELDLSSPEDAARLVVVPYERLGSNDYEVTPHYALDPQRRPVDIESITPEEILGRQKVTDVSYETISYLYERAKSGLLFVRSHRAARPRQVLVGTEGTATVGNDIEHATPEERAATAYLDAPEPPQALPQAVREQALAGDGNAQLRVNQYEKSLREHQANLAQWEQIQETARSNPEFYMVARNLAIPVMHYFQMPGLGQHEYSQTLAELHKQSELRKLPPEIRAVEADIDRQTLRFRESLSDFYQTWESGRRPARGVWPGSMQDSFLGLILARREMLRAAQTLAAGTGRDYRPLTDAELQSEIAALRQDPEYRQLLFTLNGDDFAQIFDEKVKPDEQRRLMESLCDRMLTPEGRAEKRQAWWEKLQTELNAAGCELDLNSPEDLTRLLTFDVHREGQNRYTAIPRFAADPAQRPFDVAASAADEIVARQKAGVPDAKTFLGICEAAVEGRLFVLNHKEAKLQALPRPLLPERDGTLKVGSDIDHFSGEDTALAEVIDEPVAPEQPGTMDSIRARFGNEAAQQRLRAYARDRQNYETKHAVWENIQTKDRAYVKRVQNSVLVAQNFFQNVDIGDELIRFYEQTTKLHAEAELRGMTADRRQAAEELQRRRREVVEIISSVYGTRSNPARHSGSAPLSPESKDALVRILAAQAEAVRARNALDSGTTQTYRPKTEAEYAAQLTKLHRSRRFAQISSHLTGDNLFQLVDFAGRGETEALRYLDALCSRALRQADTEEQAQWEKERNAMLSAPVPKGQYTGNPFGGPSYYCTVVEKYVDAVLTERFGRATGFTEPQLLQLREDAGKIADDAEKAPFTYTYRFPEDVLEKFCRQMNPDYRPLTAQERQVRSDNGKLLREKFNRYSFTRELGILLVNNEQPSMTRPRQAILRLGLDTATKLQNQELRRIMTAGTDAERRQVYLDLFDELNKIDLDDIDILDDASFVRNFERFAPVLSVGPEIATLLREATAVGIDLTTEENKPLIEKMGMLADMSYVARCRIDMLTHPVYSQLRFEDLQNNFVLNTAVDAEGNNVDISDLFEELGAQNPPAEAAINQIGFAATLMKDNPLFDRSLSPAVRMARYRESFWSSRKEVMQQAPNAVWRRGELIDRDPDGYDDFAEDAELEGLEEQRSGDFAADLPFFDETDSAPATDREIYKAMFRRNLQLIREVIPDFAMTEEEIDAYLTDERIALHEEALRYQTQKNAIQAGLKGLCVPEAFARIGYTFADKRGTAEAEERNEKLKETLTAGSKEANLARRDLFVGMINGLQALDPGKLRSEYPVEEMGRYVLDHVDAVSQAPVLGNTLQSLGSSLGFALSGENQQQLDLLRRRSETLGGIGGSLRDLMASRVFLTLPFDKLTAAQSLAVAEKMQKRDDLPVKPAEYFLLSDYCARKEGFHPAAEIRPHRFTAEDVIERKPTVAETKTQLDLLYTRLKGADAWYNWNNSDEYGQLVGALRTASAALSDTDGFVGSQQADQLREHLRQADAAAKKYIAHVGDAAKNARQQERLDYATELRTLLSPVLGSDLTYRCFIEVHNEDAAASYYQSARQQMLPEQEQIFRRGLERTEALRSEIDGFRAPEVWDFEDSFRYELSQRMLNAREKLTQMVGRPEINPEEVRRPIAEILLGTQVRALYESRFDGMESYEKAVRFTMADPAFTELLNGISSEQINRFLEGPGEHEFLKRYQKAQEVNRPAVERTIPNPQLRSPSVGKARSSEGKVPGID